MYLYAVQSSSTGLLSSTKIVTSNGKQQTRHFQLFHKVHSTWDWIFDLGAGMRLDSADFKNKIEFYFLPLFYFNYLLFSLLAISVLYH
jgi:hypothetical protein